LPGPGFRGKDVLPFAGRERRWRAGL